MNAVQKCVFDYDIDKIIKANNKLTHFCHVFQEKIDDEKLDDSNPDAKKALNSLRQNLTDHIMVLQDVIDGLDPEHPLWRTKSKLA